MLRAFAGRLAGAAVRSLWALRPHGRWPAFCAPPQVIILSSLQYHVGHDAWHSVYRPLWLGAALLNSLYSYFWDVERDWEIQFFTAAGERAGAGRALHGRVSLESFGVRWQRRRACLPPQRGPHRWRSMPELKEGPREAGVRLCCPAHFSTPLRGAPARLPVHTPAVPQRTCLPAPVLQPQLLYPRPFYLYLMASNFFLRLAWTHKLSPHLRKHQLAAFFFVVAEGFRCVPGRGPVRMKIGLRLLLRPVRRASGAALCACHCLSPCLGMPWVCPVLLFLRMSGGRP